ncbi:MAG: SDR family NAD(P)-dependent oxidoreductase [Deltaproteobacteria bacterium]|nr:SDR family NAD(P)-dependent oxidoreductase [Deltaproteobacteria bacterium]MBW2387075.1 SDR family NAD(P)-dependent oxidoreductase [Deltaproteobacteria bacterium]
MKLSGNTILITGGGTGIGLGLAGAFAERGNQVVICGRRQEKLDEACRRVPGLRAHRCDVSDAADRQRLFDAIADDGLAINVLINNAACMRPYDFARPDALDVDGLHRDITTNLVAPIEMIRLFLPRLREHGHPTVINVSSPGGVVPVARFPVYCASKAAMISFTRSLRHQLAEQVRVITIYPPSVDTAMMTGVSLPTISVEECNRKIMKHLARGHDEIWIGEAQYIPIFSRLMPRRIFEIVNRAASGSR